MKKTQTTLLLITLFVFLLQACKKDKAAENANKALFDQANAGGYTFFDSGNLLSGAPPSPHGSFKLRFNATAAAALDTSGRLPVGASFPNGSIIVKEVYSGNSISLLAVMKKDPGNANAGNGWLWAEYNTNGNVAFDVNKKGDGCIGCHSGTPNRDLTRTFDLH